MTTRMLAPLPTIPSRGGVSLSNPNTTPWGSPLPTAPKPTTAPSTPGVIQFPGSPAIDYMPKLPTATPTNTGVMQLPGGTMPVLKPNMDPGPAPGSVPPVIPPTAVTPPTGGGTPATATPAPAPTPPAAGTLPWYRGQTLAPGGIERLGGTQGLVDSLAGKVAETPDRFALAKNEVQRFYDEAQPMFQGALRDATKLAASKGRLGSGMLTTDYGNITDRFNTQLSDKIQGSLDNALGLTVNDRLASLGALSGLEGQQYGQAAGERDFADKLANQALDRGIQQTTLEDQLTNSDFARQQARMQLLAQLGFGGTNPTAALLDAAGQNQAASAQSGAGLQDLFYQYLFGNTVKPAGTAGAGTAGAPITGVDYNPAAPRAA